MIYVFQVLAGLEHFPEDAIDSIRESLQVIFPGYLHFFLPADNLCNEFGPRSGLTNVKPYLP